VGSEGSEDDSPFLSCGLLSEEIKSQLRR